MLLGVLLGCLSLLLLAGGVVLGLYAQRSWRRASLLGCPLSRIGKLRPGVRRVRGTVAALGKPLRSPVGDKECVYYRLVVKQQRTTHTVYVSVESALWTGDDDENIETVQSWHTLLDETYDASLTVEDDTGCVEVDLSGADVVAKAKKQIVCGGTHAPPSGLEALLRAKLGIPPVDSRGFYMTLAFVEEVLLVGAKVTIAGPVEQLESGDLCFETTSGPLVVSEGDVSKKRKSARDGAIGFAVGAVAALSVGLGCLSAAVVFIMRASLSR